MINSSHDPRAVAVQREYRNAKPEAATTASAVRLLYDIDEVRHEVQIVAVGEKHGNSLRVAGDETPL